MSALAAATLITGCEAGDRTPRTACIRVLCTPRYREASLPAPGVGAAGEKIIPDTVSLNETVTGNLAMFGCTASRSSFPRERERGKGLDNDRSRD
ncbi:hypothetical protein RCH16_003212 [Cryobacterium sp. MP_M5]|nr:hypothetical protein [Cryobacterium sp. MP_M3]MEC5178181.1 hypothetical protein [Cryobacterium sp. MP_M5]